MAFTAHAVRELKQEEQKRQHETFEARHAYMLAVIKSVDGSTTSPTQVNMTWVAMWNQPESRVLVYNNTTLNVEGTPVWIGPQMQPPWRNEIKGVYTGEVVFDQGAYSTALSVPSHGLAHQIPSNSNPGPDPVYVYSPQMMMLKTTGNGNDLTITIRGAKYIRGGRVVTFIDQDIDLTSAVPSTGLSRYVLVYLDENVNAADTVNGGTVLTASAASPPVPSMPSGASPSALVLLSSGQTYVSTADHVVDVRVFQNSYYSQNPDSITVPAPTADGQVLYAKEGQWVAGFVVTAEDGSVLVGDDGNIVFGE